MSCCGTPDPTRFRVEQHGQMFTVMSDCRACGSARRETQYHETQESAQIACDSTSDAHARARLGWRASTPTQEVNR